MKQFVDRFVMPFYPDTKDYVEVIRFMDLPGGGYTHKQAMLEISVDPDHFLECAKKWNAYRKEIKED